MLRWMSFYFCTKSTHNEESHPCTIADAKKIDRKRVLFEKKLIKVMSFQVIA